MPSAAGCIAALAILRGELPGMVELRFPNAVEMQRARELIALSVEFASPVGALIVALLMVSNVPYPHVTGKVFAGKRHIGHLIQLLLAVFIISMIRELAPLLIFWVYAVAFPCRSALVRSDASSRLIVFIASCELAIDLSTSVRACAESNAALLFNATSCELMAPNVTLRLFWCETTVLRVCSAELTRNAEYRVLLTA